MAMLSGYKEETVKNNFKILVASLMSIMMLSACSKDEDKSSRISGPGYGRGPGYPGYGSGPFIGAAVGNDYTGTLQLALEFQAQNGVAQYSGQINNFGGAVAAYGFMFIASPYQCGFSYIPAGQYEVQAVQPGQLSNGLISNMQLVALGQGAQLPITIKFATVMTSYPKLYSCASGGAMYDELVGTLNIGGCSVYVQALNYPSVCN
jgi:hypothetical protein